MPTKTTKTITPKPITMVDLAKDALRLLAAEKIVASSIVSRKDILLVEDAFEGFQMAFTENLVNLDMHNAARLFNTRILDDRERMEAIMRNIIEWGSFRPDRQEWKWVAV